VRGGTNIIVGLKEGTKTTRALDAASRAPEKGAFNKRGRKAVAVVMKDFNESQRMETMTAASTDLKSSARRSTPHRGVLDMSTRDLADLTKIGVETA